MLQSLKDIAISLSSQLNLLIKFLVRDKDYAIIHTDASCKLTHHRHVQSAGIIIRYDDDTIIKTVK